MGPRTVGGELTRIRMEGAVRFPPPRRRSEDGGTALAASVREASW